MLSFTYDIEMVIEELVGVAADGREVSNRSAPGRRVGRVVGNVRRNIAPLEEPDSNARLVPSH